jgi:hypothetical protein
MGLAVHPGEVDDLPAAVPAPSFGDDGGDDGGDRFANLTVTLAVATAGLSS